MLPRRVRTTTILFRTGTSLRLAYNSAISEHVGNERRIFGVSIEDLVASGPLKISFPSISRTEMLFAGVKFGRRASNGFFDAIVLSILALIFALLAPLGYVERACRSDRHSQDYAGILPPEHRAGVGLPGCLPLS